MALHILKLCVGATSVGDLEAWIADRLALARREGRPLVHVHTTRMTPKRRDEVIDGGALFWVIQGQVSARQTILDLRARTGADGIVRCDIVLDPRVALVRARPCRPFQGWRYLKDADAPPDLGAAEADVGAMPDEMVRDLRALGLL